MQQLEVLQALRLALAACLQVSCTDSARFEGVLRPYSQKDVEKLRWVPGNFDGALLPAWQTLTWQGLSPH